MNLTFRIAKFRLQWLMWGCPLDAFPTSRHLTLGATRRSAESGYRRCVQAILRLATNAVLLIPALWIVVACGAGGHYFETGDELVLKAVFSATAIAAFYWPPAALLLIAVETGGRLVASTALLRRIVVVGCTLIGVGLGVAGILVADLPWAFLCAPAGALYGTWVLLPAPGSPAEPATPPVQAPLERREPRRV